MTVVRLQTMQGILFCVLALIVTAVSGCLPRLNPATELMIVAILVLLLGVPHGALDTLFAENMYRVRGFSGWLLFSLAYFIPAVLVVVIWYTAPSLFLAGFLAISIVHFSGDLSAGTPLTTRLLYGGCVIILPTLLHSNEVRQIFAFLVGPASANDILVGLHMLRWPWLIGVIAASMLCMRKDVISGIEIASVGILTIVAAPLIAFAVFFCFMHSARHILRTVNYFASTPLYMLMTAAFVPMLITLCLAAVSWTWLGNIPWDARVLQIVFVGLAALTVPHMGIIERVRMSKWANPAE